MPRTMDDRRFWQRAAILFAALIILGTAMPQLLRWALPAIGPDGLDPSIIPQDNFWSAFWPSVAAEFIGGGVTGLVVGLVVARLLQRDTDRRERERARIDLNRTAVYIDLTLGGPASVTPGAARQMLPRNVLNAAETVQQSDLARFQAVLGRGHTLVAALDRLSEGYRAFWVRADQLDDHLRPLIRRALAAERWSHENDADVWLYTIGEIHGIAPEEIRPWASTWPDLDYDQAVEVVKEVLAQADGKLIQTYHDVRIFLIREAESFRRTTADTLLKPNVPT
jgi:hypothetical protein